jgi:hypothetical protein
MDQTDSVRYRRPARDPRIIRTLQLLLVTSAVMALLTLWRLLDSFAGIVDLADSIKQGATADGLVDPDSVQAFVNLAYFAFGVLTFVLLVIPIRYGLLVGAVARGHPSTIKAVRGTATGQLAATIVGLLSVLLVLGGTGYVEIGLSVTTFLPMVILWYTFIPATRRWFSEFKVDALAATGFRKIDGAEAGAAVPAADEGAA